MVLEDPKVQPQTAIPEGQDPGPRPLHRGQQLADSLLFYKEARRDQSLSDEGRAVADDTYRQNMVLLNVMRVSPNTDARKTADALYQSLEADDLAYSFKPSLLGYPEEMDEERAELFDSTLGAASTEQIERARLTAPGFSPRTGSSFGPIETESSKARRIKDIQRNDRISEMEDMLKLSGQVVTRAKGGLFQQDSASPILHSTTHKRKLADLWGVEDQPEDAFLISEAFKSYPVMAHLEQGWEALQVMDPNNQILEDEDGKYIGFTDINGNEVKKYIPMQLQEWGSEILGSITDAEMGIPDGIFGGKFGDAIKENTPGFLEDIVSAQQLPGRFILGRNQLLGSIWHYVGAQGKKGVDYDIETLQGTIPYIPNITGNKMVDRDLLMDPMFLRMMNEADSEGVFGNTLGQTLVGVGEFIAVNKAGSMLFGAAKGAAVAGMARAANGGKLATFYASNAGKGLRFIENVAKSRPGQVARGTGLNFGTVAQLRQEVFFGMAQKLWQPGSFAEGFQQGTVEGVNEFVIGRIGTPMGSGLLGRLTGVVKARLPGMRGRLQRGVGGISYDPLRRSIAVDPKNPMSSAQAFQRDLEQTLGYLPSSDKAINDELERVFVNSHMRDNIMETLDVAWIGLHLGAYGAVKQEAIESGEEWNNFTGFSPEIAKRVLNKIVTFDPTAWGTAGGMASMAGINYGANAYKGGPLQMHLDPKNPESETYQEVIGRISEYISNRAQTPSEADWLFIQNQIQYEDIEAGLKEELKNAPLGDRQGKDPLSYVGVTLGGRALTVKDLQAYRAAHPEGGVFKGEDVRRWLVTGLGPNDPVEFTTFGSNPERNANAGRTRLDPDYQLTSAEQLALRFVESEDGAESVIEALMQIPSQDLFHIKRQARAAPQDLQEGEVGASRVQLTRIIESIDAILKTRRDPDSDLPEITRGEPTPTPDVSDGTNQQMGNRIIRRDDDAEVSRASATVEEALVNPGDSWTPSENSTLEIQMLEDGTYRVQSTAKAGKVFGTFPELATAVRQVNHIRKDRTGSRKRGTKGAQRTKVHTQPNPDEGVDGRPAEVIESQANQNQNPEIIDGVKELIDTELKDMAKQGAESGEATGEDPAAAEAEAEAEAELGLGEEPAEPEQRQFSTTSQILAEDIRHDLTDEQAQRREYHAEEMLRADLEGAGFKTLAEARRAAEEGTLPDGIDANFRQVAEGRAQVPTSEQLQAAYDSVAEMHAGMPGTALDPDGGANRVAQRYLGDAEARNSLRLEEAMVRARRDEEKREAAPRPLLSPAEAGDISKVLDDVMQEALRDGDEATGLAAAAMQKALLKDQQLRGKAKEVARENAKPGEEQLVEDRIDNAEAPQEIGASFDGSLFDPRTNEDILFFEGSQAWMLGDGEGSGFDKLLQHSMSISGTDAASAGKRRALRNGALVGTQGDPGLLSLVDLVFGETTGSAKKSYKTLANQSFSRNRERIQEVLRKLRVFKKGTSGETRPLFTEEKLKSLASMNWYALASLGVQLQARGSDEGLIRKAKYTGLATEMVGKEDAPATEQLQKARQYLQGRADDGTEYTDPRTLATGDELDQAAGWVVAFAGRLRRWVGETKFKKRTGGPARKISDVRKKIKESLVRAATGQKGTPSVKNGPFPEVEGDHTSLQELATDIIEELSGVPVLTATRKSVKATPIQARSAEGESIDLVSLLDADVRQAQQEDGLLGGTKGASESDSQILHALASANGYIRRAWAELKKLNHPQTGQQFIGPEQEIDGAWGQTLLHVITSPGSTMHDGLRQLFIDANPQGGAATFEGIAKSLKKGTVAIRQMGEKVYINDEGVVDNPNHRGESLFTEMQKVMHMRAMDPSGYKNNFTEEDVEAFDYFGLIETHQTEDGVDYHIVNQGAVQRALTEMHSRLMGTMSSETAKGLTEEHALLFSIDPFSILFGGHPHMPTVDIDEAFDKANDRLLRYLHNTAEYENTDITPETASWAQKATARTARLAQGFLEFTSTRLGRTSKSTGKTPAERRMDFRSKNAQAKARVGVTRTKERAAEVIVDHLSKLSPEERPLWSQLIAGQDWVNVRDPDHLAQMLGVQNAENLFAALQSYSMNVIELGRENVESGLLPLKVWESYMKPGPQGDARTTYLMRAFWPGADGIPGRKGTNDVLDFGPSTREMLREVEPTGDSAARIMDPTLLTSMTFSQEASRNAVYGVLNNIASVTGIATEHAAELIPPYLRRRYRVAAVPPDVKVDPFSGKKVEAWQHKLWQTLEQLDNQMNPKGKDKDGNDVLPSVHKTPIKQKLIDRLLTTVDPTETIQGRMDTYGGGTLITETTGKQLEIILEDFQASKQNVGFLDEVLDTVDTLSKWWRRGRTVMRLRHVTLSVGSGVFTNHMTGNASMGDFAKSMLTGRGNYAEAAGGLANLQEYLQGRRKEDLSLLGEDGAQIQEAEWFVNRMGGSTLVSSLIQPTTDMRETFGQMIESDPNFKLGLEESGRTSMKVVESLLRDSTGRRVTVENTDRLAATAFGRVGQGPEGIVEGIDHMTKFYEQSELLMKYASYLHRKKTNPEQAATLEGRELLADMGIAGTADYSEINPWLYEWTSRYRRSSIREEFGSTKSKAKDAGLLAARILFGSPFQGYGFVMMPTLARAPFQKGGMMRTATGLAMMYGLQRVFSMVAFGDDDEQLEGASQSPQYPSLDWTSESDKLWKELYPGRAPGVMGPSEPSGKIWAMRRELATMLAKTGEGIALVNAGPNGGRSTLIDGTGFLGGGPLQLGADIVQGRNPVSRLFDVDQGRARTEGMQGFLWQQAVAAEALLSGALIRDKNRTKTEATLVNFTNWLQRNVGSDMNPATTLMSDTAMRFHEAVNLGGTPLRQAIRGIRRPEGEERSTLARIGGALTSAFLPVREINDRATFDDRYYDTGETMVKAMVGDQGYRPGMSGTDAEEHRAGIINRRAIDAVRGMYRGAFEIVTRDGAFGGGLQAELYPRLAIWGDVELATDTATGTQKYRLLPGKKPKDLSALGQFISRQDPTDHHYAIESSIRAIERAIDSEAFGSLSVMADRRDVDGAVANRIFDAMVSPRKDALLLDIKRAVEEGDEDEKRAYWKVWVGFQNMVDPAKDFTPQQRHVYDRLAVHFMRMAGSNHDTPSSREVLGNSKFIDFFPAQAAQEERK